MATPTYHDLIRTTLEENEDAVWSLHTQSRVLIKMATTIVDCLLGRGSVYLCGNGGSAADCQHLAAELVGRFQRERVGYRVISLTTDTSVLTAVGNDYGYENVFARQVEAVGMEGDVLLCFSTSGKSKNVVKAAELARMRYMHVLAFTGADKSPLNDVAHYTVRVDSTNTARVQEAHALCGHIICDIVERELDDDHRVDQRLF